MELISREDALAVVQYCENKVEGIMNLPAAQQWISVEDRLPDFGQRVLVVCKHNYCEDDDFIDILISVIFEDKIWRTWSGYKVTHWMPLPEPPKEEV